MVFFKTIKTIYMTAEGTDLTLNEEGLEKVAEFLKGVINENPDRKKKKKKKAIKKELYINESFWK